ncbi:hypothetical protein [Fodinibius sp. SL11]|uniref:hypothetical protein n=1 Tax=Fodinibius sp. SL11 TaxID=3425690 RepID=UPI003F8807AA
MKITTLLLTSLFLFSSGCSSTENTASNGNIQILNATYHNWSRSPVGSSDLPEVGTDLKITVKNWASKYSPEYIIYNNRKSLSASVSDTLEDSLVITGKIIRTSSKLPKTSETVSQSDRLVYKTEEGEQHYIEITNWESSKK